MKIIGIDPGYDRVGIAVIENNKLLHSECFVTSLKDDFHTRLSAIGLHIEEIILEHSPDTMALESLFITKNQKTAMKVAEARGVISYCAAKKNIPIHEYTPPQIKVAVSGHGGTDKDGVIKMIPLLIKMDKKKGGEKILDDEYDAIAVALTCAAYLKSSFPQK